MAHQLDFLTREHILKAIQQIDNSIISKENEWSEYWINFGGKLYQFKYTVQVASTFTETPLKPADFRSNVNSRNFIAKLGFHVLFKSHKISDPQPNYWVSASYYGDSSHQEDKFDDFIKNSYWRTDHNLESGEGLKISKDLSNVQINDRICIRYFDKKGGTILIKAMGTVVDTANVNDGRLEINWDYNPPKYHGQKPSGSGSGNWWKTFFQLKRHDDIKLIFGETPVEKRIARLAWNTFGWVKPSGSYGKSTNESTHEANYGYGHEEWLLDTNKLIEGFHYGFLEPIRKHQDAYKDKIYNVWLYSLNGEVKKKFWIGEIKNLIVIDQNEANSIKQIYTQNGWIDDMTEQIRASGAHEEGFSNWNGIDLFNVKFKPSDIFVNDPYFELESNHPINVDDITRYVFAHYKDTYNVENEQKQEKFIYCPPTKEENESNELEIKTYLRQPKAVEIVYLHKAISNALTQYLQQRYGKENVRQEHPAGYGSNRIDIVLNDDGCLFFYEIKTYNSIATSIREAFGQLMEYCFYPNTNKAKELIIVTHLPADEYTRVYFQHLRNTFEIPIYYQSYDLDKNVLSERC